MEDNSKKEYLTIAELAKLLGISRVAVFKKVKKGQIKAEKIGRNYAIPKIIVSEITGKKLGKSDKEEIDKAVHKTIKEYGKTLKLLGNE